MKHRVAVYVDHPKLVIYEGCCAHTDSILTETERKLTRFWNTATEYVVWEMNVVEIQWSLKVPVLVLEPVTCGNEEGDWNIHA